MAPTTRDRASAPTATALLEFARANAAMPS